MAYGLRACSTSPSSIPKGLRQLGVEHPKVEFYKEIKEVERRLADPGVQLHSFLVSNTPAHEMAFLWGIDRAAMLAKHIVFQDEADYVAQIVEMLVSQARGNSGVQAG